MCGQSVSVLQSKTPKPVRFEILEGTRASVAKWMEGLLIVGSEILWPGRFYERPHLYASICADRAGLGVVDWAASGG